jgi:hypothetical protein
MHFNFVASDEFDLSVLNSVESFVDHFPDFQTVWLTDEDELKLLLELMNIDEFVGHELKNTEYSKYWDLSNFKLPELDNQQFDNFYDSWVKRSSRENNMDEYGNLIFLQGLSSKWNKLKYRLIIKEGN